MVGCVGVRAQSCSSGTPPRSRSLPTAPRRSRRAVATAARPRRPLRGQSPGIATGRTRRRRCFGRDDWRRRPPDADPHQDNPQRCTALRAVRLQRQMEHRHVERCRLAAAGRQVQHVRPPAITRELLDEPLLPREWVMAVNDAKEGGESAGVSAITPAVPTSRRQSPSPMYRPVPSITGPATSQPKSMATWSAAGCAVPPEHASASTAVLQGAATTAARLRSPRACRPGCGRIGPRQPHVRARVGDQLPDLAPRRSASGADRARRVSRSPTPALVAVRPRHKRALDDSPAGESCSG